MAFAGKDVLPEKKTGFTFRGNEIILSKTRGRPLHPHWKKGYYSDKERIEVVALYAATGSVSRVAALTRVSEGAIRGWLKEPWFHELLEEIRDENDHLIDAKFNEIIGGALEQLTDRVKNGDAKLNKHGEIVRVPVSARDLSIVTAINIDKRQLLRGKPTSRTESMSNESTDDKLKRLATAFEAIAGKKLKKPETVDAEVVEVIEEDRAA